jgi:starch synthase
MKKNRVIEIIKPLKVLFIGAEMWPYASVGGLSRVMFNLPQALVDLGVDARVLIPKYGKINTNVYKMKPVFKDLRVSVGGKDDLICNVLTHQIPDGPLTYFLENEEYFELRANEYGYADDAIRWGVLQKGAWEFISQNQEWIPDIVHFNDWQTGLMANYFANEYRECEELKHIKTVFTIHSLRFQAIYDHTFVSDLDSDKGKSKIPGILSEDFWKLNSVKRGIAYADHVTTVSPTYAKEILTKEFGEGLGELLIENKAKLTGILNGIDFSDFDPETDPALHKNFRSGEWKKRQENKVFLQEKFGLEINPQIPIFIISYRLTEQKGLDLVMSIMETMLSEFKTQLIVNGDGESIYKKYFNSLKDKYPNQVGLNMQFDENLPRLLFAGGDILIHPSRFEPCGIVQLEAMRYGCVPLVRRVGGLADTVIDRENGFTFDKFEANSLLITMSRAYELFKHEELFDEMRTDCMLNNFSWHSAAKKYLRLYKKLI